MLYEPFLSTGWVMALIIEGMDNAGKSTLARFLSPITAIVESEGPAKYPGELIDRIARYGTYKDVVFVRHPCVSDPIYSAYRNNGDALPFQVISQFYEQGHTFVYCDPGSRGLKDHVVKEGESSHHLKMVEARYDDLLRLYRAWAIRRAHFIYRIGDDMDRLCSILKPLV
jgi:hypothetical protein